MQKSATVAEEIRVLIMFQLKLIIYSLTLYFSSGRAHVYFPPTWIRESLHQPRSIETIWPRHEGLNSSKFALDRYHSLKEIDDYLDSMAVVFPDVMTVMEVGRTFEDRALKLCKISVKSNKEKPIFWVDGGIHAREWVSVSTALYVIHQLLMGRLKDASINTMLELFDFYIMPVVNPDGYEYSRTKDRMWRKNRSHRWFPFCKGVDLNRNFAFGFGGQSSSANPCHERYHGPEPFSEEETRAIRDVTTKIGPQLKVILSLHSFDQLWLFPAKISQCLLNDTLSMESLAQIAIKAIERANGKQYNAGTINKLIGDVGGASVDWTYNSLGVLYSFAVELRDKGRYGFTLPEDQLVQTGREVFEAIREIILNMPIYNNGEILSHLSQCERIDRDTNKEQQSWRKDTIFNSLKKYFTSVLKPLSGIHRTLSRR